MRDATVLLLLLLLPPPHPLPVAPTTPAGWLHLSLASICSHASLARIGMLPDAQLTFKLRVSQRGLEGLRQAVEATAKLAGVADKDKYRMVSLALAQSRLEAELASVLPPGSTCTIHVSV